MVSFQGGYGRSRIRIKYVSNGKRRVRTAANFFQVAETGISPRSTTYMHEISSVCYPAIHTASYSTLVQLNRRRPFELFGARIEQPQGDESTKKRDIYVH